MSALQVYMIDCDAPGCDDRCDTGLNRAHAARARARELGWTHHIVVIAGGGPAPSVDLCPDHVGVDPRDALANSLAQRRA